MSKPEGVLGVDYVELDLKNRGGRIQQIIDGKSGLPESVRQAYIDHWDKMPEKLTITKAEIDDMDRRFNTPRLPCTHRGKVIRQQKCGMCGGRDIMFEVYSCEVHGECSLNSRDRKISVCLGCPDRLEPKEKDPS